MAQARAAASPSPRVQIIAPAKLGETALVALHARGIDAHASSNDGGAKIGAIELADDAVLALAFDSVPTASDAVELAQTCAAAAGAGRPVCVLAPAPRGSGRTAIERAAAIAYLRAHGAALAHDVDAWLEATVALVRFGMPRGPHAAVIAPAGSWLEAQALAVSAEHELLGARPIAVGKPGKDDPTDVVLYDPGLAAPSGLAMLAIPVVPRGELGGDAPALYGIRAALGAIDMLGRAAERIAHGLGPAPASASAELAIDRERLDRQLAKLVGGSRVGDHETKTLLHAYGVPITKQAVALTPSSAVKKARSVGFPVELKPWGPDAPTERDGCPVERGVTSDALVRRAFAAVLAAAGLSAEGSAVIVRQAPPLGRDLAVSITKLPALGWTVLLETAGQLAAAPAPLRVADANALASAVVATRAGDPEPDRAGLANILRRASYLAVDLDPRLAVLELPRVVVGGRGARSVVADAWCRLT